MIKKCIVIFTNDIVSVILYDGKKIQLPSLKTRDKYVYVKFEDDKYSIVSENEYNENLSGKKTKAKNTTDKSRT